MRLAIRHASPVAGSQKDASFNRATFDATWYSPAAGGTFVARLRAGTVPGSGPRVVGLGALRIAEPRNPPKQIDEGDCPPTYVPRFGSTFWNRLTFQFSIGQPF